MRYVHKGSEALTEEHFPRREHETSSLPHKPLCFPAFPLTHFLAFLILPLFLHHFNFLFLYLLTIWFYFQIWCTKFGVRTILPTLTSFTEVHGDRFTSDKIDVESWEGWVVPEVLACQGKKAFSGGFEQRLIRKGTAHDAEWPHGWFRK